MSFSYLNNSHIKFNNNSCWFATNKKEYGLFVLIETLIRERITHKLIYNKEFFLFDLNIDIRTKTHLQVSLNLKYQLAYKKMRAEEISDIIKGWLLDIQKRFNIEKINVKPTQSTGDKSAFCFAQILAREMSKYISHKRIRMLAKAHISNKAPGYIIKLGGRINGNGIARHDKVQKGLISRNTFKNDIDFATFTYVGKSGCVGIKVWINRGLLPTRDQVVQDISQAENN